MLKGEAKWRFRTTNTRARAASRTVVELNTSSPSCKQASTDRVIALLAPPRRRHPMAAGSWRWRLAQAPRRVPLWRRRPAAPIADRHALGEPRGEQPAAASVARRAPDTRGAGSSQSTQRQPPTDRAARVLGCPSPMPIYGMAASYLQPTTYHLLLTTYYVLPTTHYSHPNPSPSP